MNYKRENEWKSDDFLANGWHDCRIYSMSFVNETYEIAFEIDYIFEWVRNIDELVGFIVAPCKVTFKNVSDMTVSMSFENRLNLYIVDFIETPTKYEFDKALRMHNYHIITDSGDVKFVSSGFDVKILSAPTRSKTQDIGR